jgi:hypothetical protein
MNIHISAYVAMDEGAEEVLRELVADFADSLCARGFGNDPSENPEAHAGVDSMIAVKQYPDYLQDPEGFLREQLDGAFLVVLPTNKGEEDVG